MAGLAPLILPTRGWAGENAPSQRLNLGFIGCGLQARGLLRDFQRQPGVQVVAVCDVDRSRRENHRRLAEEFYARSAEAMTYTGCTMHADFRELLARPEVDAVVIATPDHWHALQTVAAAVADKDVYCEKPLTQTIEEARVVLETVRAHGRILQTGSQQRSSPEFRLASELVRNGLLGTVTRIEAAFGGPARWCDLAEETMEPGLDWDGWLGPAPRRPYNAVLAPRGVNQHFPKWRSYREYGGGNVTDWGAHHMDIVHWALGMDESGPEAMIPPADWETAVSGGRLLYPGGVEVRHTPGNGLTFFGTEGEVTVARGEFRLSRRGVVELRAQGQQGDEPLEKVLATVEERYLRTAPLRLAQSTNHQADFLQAVRTRKQPVAGVEAGARSVTACHLLNLGYYYGERILWDAERFTFAPGTGDPRRLSREYREPWNLLPEPVLPSAASKAKLA